jgi:prephenate dehydrogenase
MPVQITIIGLGQIGGSIGLGLSAHKELVVRTGHDREPQVARQAEKVGALDRIEFNLPNSVRNADLVVLALPIDQIRETLAIIAPDLREGAVVMDTGPAKEVVADWVSELLPAGRYYIGLTPVLNPAYLFDLSSGIDAARPDLFRGGLMAIAAPPRTTSEVIKLASDLTRLLGATPLFVDPLEIDGLIAATHLLPQLLSAALVNATIDQPGWREGWKIAGRSYAEVTAPIAHLGAPESLRAAAIFNRSNALRMIDSVIASLQALRASIEAHDETSLEERLKRAYTGRSTWWKQRQASEWGTSPDNGLQNPELSSQSIFGRLIGYKPRQKK